METKTYRVRVVRPVFQVVAVEVEASSEDEAILEAIVQADTVPEDAWSGEFDPDSYFYDVLSVQEASGPEEGYLDPGIEDDRKYLLLRGDIDSGTGAMPFQPWMTDISDLMLVDLCQDWASDLASLEQAGAAGFYSSLDRQIKARDQTLAKVLPFRRPGSSVAEGETV